MATVAWLHRVTVPRSVTAGANDTVCVGVVAYAVPADVSTTLRACCGRIAPEVLFGSCVNIISEGGVIVPDMVKPS